MCMLVLISFVAPCHKYDNKRTFYRNDSLTTLVTLRGAIRYTCTVYGTVRMFTGIWFWVKCTTIISMLLAAVAGWFMCALVLEGSRQSTMCTHAYESYSTQI